MKRKWQITKYLNNPGFKFAILFYGPLEDDYYDSQYSIQLILFGLIFSLETWKE